MLAQEKIAEMERLFSVVEGAVMPQRAESSALVASSGNQVTSVLPRDLPLLPACDIELPMGETKFKQHT